MVIEPEVTREFMRIIAAIRDTPRAAREVVEQYHQGLIRDIDSEGIIPVASMHHRMLHQVTWLSGHMIYNGYSDLDSAERDFDEIGEKIRFDIWYARHYVEPHKEDNNKWGLDILKQADREAREYYGHSLDEVAIVI